MIPSVDALLEKRFVPVPGYTPMAPIYQSTKTLVYRALATESQRPVIIKYLNQEYPSFEELVQFRHQYTITKNLSIPGIVKPLELKPCGHSYALIMEDVGGVSLEQYAQQQMFDVAESLAIAIQLADILHDLQQHRVIHKDIKPANILIHPDSKQSQPDRLQHRFTVVQRKRKPLQSPQNVWKEHWRIYRQNKPGRMNRGIDYRTDFYSLGVTLYRLLSGQLPFVSDDPHRRYPWAYCSSSVAQSMTINPMVPVMVADLVAKLMAKNAEDRYQSALGLKHDLERCLAQSGKTQGQKLLSSP